MKTMKQIREDLSDFVQHLGWAFLGQECDCGYNKFNAPGALDGQAGSTPPASASERRAIPCGWRGQISRGSPARA